MKKICLFVLAGVLALLAGCTAPASVPTAAPSQVAITCLQPDAATLAAMQGLAGGRDVYNPAVVPIDGGHEIVAFGYGGSVTGTSGYSGGFGLSTYLAPPGSSDVTEWVLFPGAQWDESRQWDESAAPSYDVPWGDYGLTDDEFVAANKALYMAVTCASGA